MSIVYRIDEEAGITFAVWDGTITADDFLAQLGRLIADPAWPPPRRLQLTDLRMAVLDSSVDLPFLERAAKFVAPHKTKLERLKVALVAEGAFAKSIIFQKLLSQVTAGYGMSMIVFNAIGTACTWLGIDVEQAEKALEELRPQARGMAPGGDAPAA